MASRKTLLYLGLFLCAEIITAADPDSKAENVRWTSLDFKTMLTWTTKTPQRMYTVKFSRDESDWDDHLECTNKPASACDMSAELKPFDRSYTADILTEPENNDDYDYSHDERQHTESPPFNPYRESNISAVEFSVQAVNESTVVVNITDTLTSVHEGSKQLTIRDIFKKALKYKITYHKSMSTGKKEHLSDSSVAEVSKLDAGTSYCFMVTAYIPSRPKSTQDGAGSRELCEQTSGIPSMHELSMGALVGLIFVLLTAIIIIVTVTALCCRNRQERNKTLQTTQSQTSAPV